MAHFGSYVLTAAALASLPCQCLAGACGSAQWQEGSITIKLPGPPVLPPGALRHLRFSPNGQYVLAQDSSRVTVLTVDPFAVLFGAPAQNASLAEFSPDSREVLFVSSVTQVESGKLVLASSAPRVERWSIGERKRVGFTEIHSRPCGTLQLSPDGRVLGCVDFEGTLTFSDVGSPKAIFEKKGLCRPFVEWFPFNGGWGPVPRPIVSGDPGSAGIEFSPDGRLALATHGAACESSPVFGWDCVTRKAIKLGGELRQTYPAGTFVFVAANRALILGGNRVRKGVYTCTVVSVPSGRVLLRPALPARWDMQVYRAADPNFVIYRPFGKFLTAAAEYSTGRIITSGSFALDVFGNHYVTERTNGELGLYERGKAGAVAVVSLAHE
ncbi:MAG: hypothetical protein ABSH46_10945 [Bryobacteraceae bacterium]